MKNNTPKGKKSQYDQTGQPPSPSDMPYNHFQDDEEEVDLEILDALEQMEQAGDEGSESVGEDNTFTLDLDDENLILDDEEGDESGFHFDESMTAELEQELQEDAGGLDLGESFDMGAESEDDIQASLGEDTFSIDLDQEEPDEDMGFSLDEEDDFDLESIAREASSAETNLDLGDEGDALELDAGVDTAFDLGEEGGQLELDTGMELEASEDDVAFDFGEEGGELELDTGMEIDASETDAVFDFGEESDGAELDTNMDFETSSGDLSFDLGETGGDLELAGDDQEEEAAPGMMDLELEIDSSADFSEADEFPDSMASTPDERDFSLDAGLEEEGEAELDLGGFSLDEAESETENEEDFFETEADKDVEETNTELDLSMETADLDDSMTEFDTDLDEDMDFDTDLDLDTDFDSPKPDIVGDSFADTKFGSLDLENESDELKGKSVIAVGEDQVIDLGNEEDIEQAQDWEDEDSSLEPDTLSDMAENASSEMEYSDEAEDEDFGASFDDIDVDLEAEATKVLGEGDELEQMDSSASETALSDFKEESSLETEEDDLDLGELEPSGMESEEDIRSEEEVEIEEEEEEEEEEEIIEPEIDDRELLGLSLRLEDVQVEKFEQLVNEAQTLQSYIDELDHHQAEIKDTIYQKLHGEYQTRKTTIFKTSEFTELRRSVEQDLQDMLAKREEFVSTTTRLNDELEEITVRHLVGEYDDQTLSERERTQKEEIEEWQEKTEKIEKFITRYQESLDAERELNPNREEFEVESPPEEEPGEMVGEDYLPEEEEREAATLPEEVTSEDTASPEEEESSGAAAALEEETFEEESQPPVESEPGAEEEEEEDFFAASEETDENFGGLETTLEHLDEMDFSEDEGAMPEDFSLESDITDETFDSDALSSLFGEAEPDKPTVDAFDEFEEEDTEQEEMISCKKCGRETPASEKFCVYCGAKAR